MIPKQRANAFAEPAQDRSRRLQSNSVCVTQAIISPAGDKILHLQAG